MNEKDKLLYEKTLKKWGTEFQVIMLGEEFSELFFTISKTLRGKINVNDAHVKIADEIADVQIMLEQMMVLFNINEKIVKGRRAMKLGRLEEMMEKEEEKPRAK